jgi:hypothetical protein
MEGAGSQLKLSSEGAMLMMAPLSAAIEAQSVVGQAVGCLACGFKVG